MGVVWTTSLLEFFLNQLLGDPSYPMSIHLFTNNYTPDCSMTLADFTEVTGDSDYAPASIAGASSWSQTFAACVAQGSTGPYSFNFANSQTIYGYYVTNASGQLCFAEALQGGPYTVSPGTPVPLLLVLQFGNCP